MAPFPSQISCSIRRPSLSPRGWPPLQPPPPLTTSPSAVRAFVCSVFDVPLLQSKIMQDTPHPPPPLGPPSPPNPAPASIFPNHISVTVCGVVLALCPESLCVQMHHVEQANTTAMLYQRKAVWIAEFLAPTTPQDECLSSVGMQNRTQHSSCTSHACCRH